MVLLWFELCSQDKRQNVLVSFNRLADWQELQKSYFDLVDKWELKQNYRLECKLFLFFAKFWLWILNNQHSITSDRSWKCFFLTFILKILCLPCVLHWFQLFLLCIPPLPEYLILWTLKCFTCACSCTPLPFVRLFLFRCVSHLGCVLNSEFCLLCNLIDFLFWDQNTSFKISICAMILITKSHKVIIFCVFAFWPFEIVFYYYYFAYISWHETNKIIINDTFKYTTYYTASKSTHCLMSERDHRVGVDSRGR